MTPAERLALEIEELLLRIADGDRQLHECREEISNLSSEAKTTSEAIMRFGELDRLQEHRRSMLVTLQQQMALLGRGP